MREFRKRVGFFSLLLVTTSVLLTCGQGEVEQSKEPVVRPVKMLTIAKAGTGNSNTYPAVINAASFSELSFPVGGLLQEIAIKAAQDIKQGDVLAKLDQRDFRNKVNSARAQFEKADTEYQRAVRLAKEDAISKSVLEQRKSDRDVIKAQLDSAEKALGDTVLRAPFSGTIAQVPVNRSQNIQPGQLIATLIGGEELEAVINLPAAIIATVPTQTDTTASMFLEAEPDVRIPATFKEASLIADAISQTYAVTFSFIPPEKLLILPGMNGMVEISSNQEGGNDVAGGIAVPFAALMNDSDGQFAWVVDIQTMTVSKRPVVIEPGIGETAVVLEGLSAGETIVGAGAAYLAEGMKVRRWNGSTSKE